MNGESLQKKTTVNLKQFICTSCGCDALTISEDGRFAKCRGCGITFQMDSTLSDMMLIDYSLATHAWKNFRFAEAKQKFLDITKKLPNFSEAYFGAFLSEYGIEWGVNRLGETIPTCHRAHIVSVYDDENYKKALLYSSNKESLQEKGEKIENIRKQIIEKSKQGRNYDIFICFKATEIDDDRRKTMDYDLGRELYKYLTDKNYKVFFSPETLLSVKEQEFEPYIYKALSTSKVMLLLCSDEKKIESPWVKNEWERFLDIHDGQGLIPICGNKFEPFSPMRLPLELSKFNAIEYDINLLEAIDKKLKPFFPKDETPEKIVAPVHQHDYKTKLIPATCIAKGYTLHYCKCGNEYKTNYKKITSHSFHVTNQTDPTCERQGEKTICCSICGLTKTSSIPATGHKFDSWHIQPGNKELEEHFCKFCGMQETRRRDTDKARSKIKRSIIINVILWFLNPIIGFFVSVFLVIKNLIRRK